MIDNSIMYPIYKDHLWGLLLPMLEKADAQSRTGRLSNEKVGVVTSH